MTDFREKQNALFVLKLLNDRLKYSEDVAGFLVKKSSQFRGLVGERAGFLRPDRRRIIQINKVRYFEHHLVWLLFNGEFCKTEIDHCDRNPENNVIENLRESTPSYQGANRYLQSNNSTGYKGVCLLKNKLSKPFKAQIKSNGKSYHIGYFHTAEEAAAAYDKYAEKLFNEFSCTNKELSND